VTDEELFEVEKRRRSNPIFAQGQWICTEFGLYGDRSADYIYEIPRDRLDEGLWIAQIASKSWADTAEFIEVLYRARQHFGIGDTDRTHVAYVTDGHGGVLEFEMDRESAAEAYKRKPHRNEHLAGEFGEPVN